MMEPGQDKETGDRKSADSVVSQNGHFVPNTTQYEGPMDLLLHVVRQKMLDLSEIYLSDIASDFLNYARDLSRLDLDHAGEFIHIASLLMKMKARMLLPHETIEEQQEVEEALFEDEIEDIYREVVATARELAHSEKKQRDHFFRGSGAEIVQIDETGELLSDVNLVDLAEAFREVHNRMNNSPVHQLSLFKVTVAMQSRVILSALKLQGKIQFEELASRLSERIEVVVTFLAMLELIRNKAITVKQRGLFGIIYIQQGPEFDSFSATQADYEPSEEDQYLAQSISEE